MKKFFSIYLIAALLAFAALPGCGGKEGPSVPPPPYQPGEPENPQDPEDPEDPGEDPTPTTPPGAWEANRGKQVTPSGSGWTSKSLNGYPGITFYSFSGTDPASGVKQCAYAVDLDLSNPNYAVKMTYSNPTLKTSEVHANYLSIATINAGYEAGSIYIRVDDKEKSSLPNTVIGSTGVRNWKSEAGIFMDVERTISIDKAEELIRPYVSPDVSEMNAFIRKERNYYAAHTEKYVLSSSPLLIYDYNPVGETFIDYTISNWTKLNTEEPQYHQRKRHPRTAVALTEFNHFIMIVVDGRQTGTGRYGMSAKELTKFLVNNFNPQYALNLDGGGSTAMCVKGLPDASYVDESRKLVNSPIQDNKPANERARDTHIIIVEK